MADGTSPFKVIEGGKLSPCDRVLRAYRIVEDAETELALNDETGGLPLLAHALVVTLSMRIGLERTAQTLADTLTSVEAAQRGPQDAA